MILIGPALYPEHQAQGAPLNSADALDPVKHRHYLLATSKGLAQLRISLGMLTPLWIPEATKKFGQF